jgi:hypothetical protein
MKYAEIDKSNAPVIVIRFNPVEPTAEQFDLYLKEMTGLFDFPSKYSLIMDATNAIFLNSDLRMKQGIWIKEHNALTKEKIAVIVFVIPSAIVRILLNTIFLIQKPAAPYFICSKMDEALKKAKMSLVELVEQ